MCGFHPNRIAVGKTYESGNLCRVCLDAEVRFHEDGHIIGTRRSFFATIGLVLLVFVPAMMFIVLLVWWIANFG
jgi:hypothetical protein